MGIEPTVRAPSTRARVTAITTGVSDISADRKRHSSKSASLPGDALLWAHRSTVSGLECERY